MKNKGFTLVELSIVLVVISLFIGGVLVGQNMIKSAELNSFVRDMQKLKGAILNFQSQYNNLPGDMDTAFDYFSTECAATSTLCNGDGDGIAEEAETFRAWKHLDAAKFTNSGTTAVTGTSVTCAIGTNMPRTAIDNASAAILHDLGASYSNDTTEARTASLPIPGQMLQFGKVLATQTAVANCADAGFLSSQQAYSIDKKIDDGLAYNGYVLNSENLSGCTASAGTADDLDYDQANSGNNLCKLFYRFKAG
jgi:prepilin-type N-terminal cleavage/methylation domain-containing protein